MCPVTGAAGNLTLRLTATLAARCISGVSNPERSAAERLIANFQAESDSAGGAERNALPTSWLSWQTARSATWLQLVTSPIGTNNMTTFHIF